ncbi:MAG: hypothetical protein RL380_39, partial [Verrucomicrobiota bacterium]
MGTKKIKTQDNAGATVIQLNLVGLVVFSVSLVVAAGLVTFGLVSWRDRQIP